jgi:hypothetical protein
MWEFRHPAGRPRACPELAEGFDVRFIASTAGLLFDEGVLQAFVVSQNPGGTYGALLRLDE